MPSEPKVARPGPRGGRADKRSAILAGALAVFARDGYTRASIDAIATQASVSTRTIYNHFTDKAHLFESVIEESAAGVADARIAIMDRHLRKVTDLEADLIAFGRELASPDVRYADHVALVRQINADVGHIPPAALEAWQQAGPARVRRELAAHLRRLDESGMLRVEDADAAALHLLLLLHGTVPANEGVTVVRDADIAATVTAGVRAFLYGYAR